MGLSEAPGLGGDVGWEVAWGGRGGGLGTCGLAAGRRARTGAGQAEREQRGPEQAQEVCVAHGCPPAKGEGKGGAGQQPP